PLPALRQCWRNALVTRCGFFSPKPSCTAAYPSVAAVFVCTTVHGPAWITVTGINSPLESKTWFTPTFLPMSPISAGALQFDLNGDGGGEVEFAEGVDGLLCRFEDIQQPFVGANLELLAGLLVHVRRAIHGETFDMRGQRNGTGNAAARLAHGLDDFLHRL